jgi:hypothetical protein
MKKLLWLTGIVGLICAAIIFKMLSDPSVGIVGISNEDGKRFSELTVLKRDGSFEQFVTDKTSQKVILNVGSWVDAARDPSSQVVMSQAGEKTDEKYLSLKGKIEIQDVPATASLSSARKIAIALIPSLSFRRPHKGEIEKIEALRKTATTVEMP